MSIYRRKSGRFAVLVDLEPSASGLRRRRSLGTFPTRKDAERAEREALTARDRGIEIVPAKMTLDQLFERFMRDAEARNLSGTTLYGYREIWKRVAPIAALPVGKLKPAHLVELYGDLGRNGWENSRGPLSARSIRHTHALLRTILAWGVRLEIITRNVADVVQPPHGPKRHARPYERADAMRLIEEAAKTRFGALVIFDFETGLRRGELAGLRWTDIDLAGRTATIRGAVAHVPGRTWYKATKTESVAKIALSDIALEALRSQRVQQAKDKLAAGELYSDLGYVFAPAGGGTPSPSTMSKAVRKIATRAGLSIRGIHAMRHSTGSWLIRAGVDVRTVAAVLRHSSAATTLNVYAHELEGAQAEAVKHLLGAGGNRLATATGTESDKPS
jgi:integrase